MMPTSFFPTPKICEKLGVLYFKGIAHLYHDLPPMTPNIIQRIYKKKCRLHITIKKIHMTAAMQLLSCAS